MNTTYYIKRQERRNRLDATRRRLDNMRGTMDYQSGFRYLTDKAHTQANYRIVNRDVDWIYRRAVQVHGTHVWVSKQEWKKHLSSKTRLDPTQYRHTSPIATDVHTYAIPVPGTPVIMKVYNTDVAIMQPNGDTILYAGKWRGYFTQKWLNMLRHVNVRGIRMDRWSGTEWGLRDAAGTLTMFYDGLTIDKDGKIISEVQPFVKHVVDREKSKPWHAAVKHYRNLSESFVAMLDGVEIPEPILEAMRDSKKIYSNEYIAGEILSMPEDLYPVLTVMLCLQRWYGHDPKVWSQGDRNHVIHHTQMHFEQRLKQVYREWAKANALKSA
jgi:hypothetical protein